MQHIETNDFLIVGSPKGVGFSTYIAEWIAYKVFFEEDFSALILTDSRRDKLGMAFKIKKAFEYYQYPLEYSIEEGKHILYTKGDSGSGVCIINYDEFDLDSITDEQDAIIIDNDDFSSYLYNHVPKMKEIAKKLVFNTYDVPHSIFYNIKAPKVIISSKFSRENIRKNYNRYPNRINFDRILLGAFEDY